LEDHQVAKDLDLTIQEVTDLDSLTDLNHIQVVEEDIVNHHHTASTVNRVVVVAMVVAVDKEVVVIQIIVVEVEEDNMKVPVMVVAVDTNPELIDHTVSLVDTVLVVEVIHIHLHMELVVKILDKVMVEDTVVVVGAVTVVSLQEDMKRGVMDQAEVMDEDDCGPSNI